MMQYQFLLEDKKCGISSALSPVEENVPHLLISSVTTININSILYFIDTVLRQTCSLKSSSVHLKNKHDIIFTHR